MPTSTPPAISVIIPLGPGEQEWRGLVQDLVLPEGSEIILACGSNEINVADAASPVDLRTANGGAGRAAQMNVGATAAQQDWLWFLHADSRLTDTTLAKCRDAVSRKEDALFFFDLVFRDDGPAALSLNEWAVRFRAGVLKIPFGDQGFLIRKSLFEAVGGYREDLAYGEDHVFVWKVRQEGYRVVRTGGGLMTSGRKYHRGGWLKVTGLHVWLTLKQALPQYVLLWRRRLERWFS